MRPKPLHGIRVLDLTRLLPGPVATMHLADLGAEVIKIEDTGAGDYGRLLGQVRNGVTALFRLVNRNKRGLRLDLKQEAGREVFLRLARNADLIIESFRPGVMERLGLGYPVVEALNPRIVYCAISGYGQDGPYRDCAGHDINFVGYSGVGDQIGAEDGPPVLANIQIADLLGGALTSIMGILAALLDARASGRGRFVDVSMTDSVLAHAILPLVGLIEGAGATVRGTGLLSGGLPCYGLYGTSDHRYMAVGPLEQKFWEKMCEMLGCPELKSRHYVYGDAARPVKQRLISIFSGRTQAEWTKMFEGSDCCVTPVLDISETVENEQINARQMVLRDAAGQITGAALPLKFTDFRFEVERPAPAPGEHSGEILREAGYSASEIERLARNGVI